MLGANDNHRVEESERNSYDVRIGALEKDVAVMQSSLATKDDFHALRSEMQAGHERILTLLYGHKLESQEALAADREDFHTALAQQREYFNAALAEQREYFNAALAEQREYFNAALAKQREEFNAALAKQREEFYAALAETKLDLHKSLIGHLWKLYGFASMMVAGVYFIARYVH
ncbi:hypothetical protein GTP58_28960 [Duganella sp. CY15W]|uniref:hypothetical protein n=1 Tax=Duganella sp. CY15W TaxID=2692172 RepID=UPI00136BB4CC|nr:hypothetical protein [Duganella sp. CY15W]MYM32369.1 hypothetical protein [Duganella sp. CY15W]